MMRLPVVLASLLILSCSGNKRTQEPREPLPYESNEVNFQSSEGDVILSATLTTPVNDTLKTAVILISGSGRSDRDYTNGFGHRPFLVLSDYLTRQGISVLRYDERGVGRSDGNYEKATYQDLVGDVTGGIKYLRENGFERVGLIGHSEGGGIASIASLQAETDFLVLMAPDHSTADQSLILQTRARLRDLNAERSVSIEIIAALDSMLYILRSESDIMVAKAKMENLIIEKDKSAAEDYRKTTEKLGDVRQLIQGFLEPKFIYRLHHDPKETFTKVRVPVLVLFGDQDSGLDIATDLPLIESALESTQHEIRIFPGLGHLFMDSKGVPVNRLHEVDQTISPDVLSAVGEWILFTIKRGNNDELK